MTAPADLVRRLRLEAPHSEDRALLEQAATVIEALGEKMRDAADEGWDSGCVEGHTTIGRLTEKRGRNPYAVPGEFEDNR